MNILLLFIFFLAILYVIVYFCRHIYLSLQKYGFKIKKCPYDPREYIVVIYYKRPKRIKAYIGSPTVFHNFPSGKRVDTLTESWLCDLFERHEILHGRFYDTWRVDEVISLVEGKWV